MANLYNLDMEVIALQSGSNGNCIYVEAGGKQLLFDAGISGAQAEKRLAQHGRDIRDVDALIISHDHSDHTRCMGVYHRKFGLPIHVTDETMSALQRTNRIGRIDEVQRFKSGSTLDFGQVRVETIKTPHDAVDGVAFVVDDGSNRLGILTDLGHVFSGLDCLLSTLDAVIIESNYDHRNVRPAALTPNRSSAESAVQADICRTTNQRIFCCDRLIERCSGFAWVTYRSTTTNRTWSLKRTARPSVRSFPYSSPTATPAKPSPL